MDNKNERGYLNLLRKILDEGEKKETRNGNTISIFGAQLEFDVSKDTFPLLTSKRMFYRGITEELLWFLRGDTNAKKLQEKNVHIWDGNSTREYLDSIGLTDREEGDLGPVYGYQWRHFNAPYTNCHDDYTGKGIDQIKFVVEELKKNPSSRRAVLHGWNPCQLKEKALPPCHLLYNFNLGEKGLSCHMYQRSADCFLGLPFNIASTTLFTYIISNLLDVKPHKVVISIGDAHIYENHLEQVKTQLSREEELYTFPNIEILKDLKTLEDMENLDFKDFKVTNYEYHPGIKASMNA